MGDVALDFEVCGHRYQVAPLEVIDVLEPRHQLSIQLHGIKLEKASDVEPSAPKPAPKPEPIAAPAAEDKKKSK